MYRKIVITGVTAAAIVGASGVALATTGSNVTTGTPSPSSTSSSTPDQHHAKTGDAGKGDKGKGDKGKGDKRGLLKHLAHGQFVTKGKQGVITHDLIKGTVTSVSPTSITVQAIDKKSETFSVGKDTVVLIKAKGQKAAKATISKVAKGDHVFVAGTGASAFAAKHIVDVGTGTK